LCYNGKNDEGRNMTDIRSIVIGVVLMLKKYTCINITIYEDEDEEDYKNGVFVLPLIGFFIGFIALLISSFRFVYDSLFVSTLILFYYCIITGTVNMRDTYKTLNYYIKPGTQSEHLTGQIGITLVIMMYISLFRTVPPPAVAVAYTAGFSNLIISSALINRDKENTSIIKHCTKYHIIAAFGISFLAAAILNYRLVIPLSLTYMLSGAIISTLDEKVETLPSSAEGLIIEATQLLFLIVTYLLKI